MSSSSGMPFHHHHHHFSTNLIPVSASSSIFALNSLYNMLSFALVCCD
jgi:hypothetical protein